MHIQNEIQKLMQKDMSRKEFLKHVGVGFVAIAGLTTILKTVTSMNGPSSSQQTSGYGASVYGGKAANSSASPSQARKLQS